MVAVHHRLLITLTDKTFVADNIRARHLRRALRVGTLTYSSAFVGRRERALRSVCSLVCLAAACY